ncbi:MAG: Hpt domain-containing protein, partial [Lysobacter sp.]|nr:Hpt domain-containing protein [Lysobacter sp.]
MSTGIASDGAATGLDEFQSRLDTLVMLLQAAHQVSDMAEPALLHEMIGTLQASAADAGLPGVAELLRSWKAALHDRLRGETPLAGDDLLQTTIWFMTLQEHVAGRLDANGREMLAQLPEGILWLPQLSPALVRAILRKLESTPSASLAADVASMARTDADTASRSIAADAPTEDAPTDAPTDVSTKSDIAASADDGRIENARSQPPHVIGSLDVTADLLAQLPPEFLAAFPPGALDDLPPDVLEALLSETRYGGDDIFASPGIDSASQAAAFAFDETDATDTGDIPAFADIDAKTDPVLVANDDPNAEANADAEAAFDFGDATTDTPLDAIAADPPNMEASIEADIDANIEADTDETSDTTAATIATHETTLAETRETQTAAAFAFSADAPPPSEAIGDIEAPIAVIDAAKIDDEPAFAFDDMPAVSADDASVPIWIGREELDLTRQAILEQVLPLAQAWADTPDADASGPILDELSYQCQLVVNVMELIGTRTLAQGMDVVRVGIEARDPAVTPETVAIWCSVLLATIETPNAESAESLAIASLDVPDLDEAWRTALVEEFARVRIGLDPALIAERKTQALPEDIALAPADDVLPSVLDGMLRELPGNATRFGASVRALAETGAFDAIDEARRVAHTLKGDANTVGVRGLANLTHALEDILIVLAKRPELLDAECADLLIGAGDTVEEIADHLLGRGPAPGGFLDTYQHVLDTANALMDGADAV